MLLEAEEDPSVLSRLLAEVPVPTPVSVPMGDFLRNLNPDQLQQLHAGADMDQSGPAEVSMGASSSAVPLPLPAPAYAEGPPLPPPVGPPPGNFAVVPFEHPPRPIAGTAPRRQNYGRVRRGEAWGVFTFVFKDQGAVGGYEATCPFHQGTATAKTCRKFLPMRSAEDGGACVLRAKAWCLGYQFTDRKRRHLRYDPELDFDCTDAAAIEAMIVTELPDPDSIIPDEVFLYAHKYYNIIYS